MAEHRDQPGRDLSGWLAAAVALVVAVLAAGGARGLVLDRQETRQRAEFSTAGSIAGGKEMMRLYGCAACHTVPGIPGATGTVGPSLDGIAGRLYIAGHLENQPQTMVRWIMDPPGLVEGTAMPRVGVDEQEARDIAAYLYTLK
jgi:cytochrome c2